MIDNLTSVAEDQTSPWRLTDLIDVDTLQSIQDTFARAFGLPTVIVTPDGENATQITHRVSFCEDYTRMSEVGGPRCKDCDLRAMTDASKSGRPAIFHCWNGMYDCAIPIAPKGTPLGYFLCGQVLTEHPGDERYRETALEIGVPEAEYLAASKGVRIIPLETYRASVDSMHVLAEMIAEQAAAAMDNYRMLEEGLRARDDASRLMLELDAILEAFNDIGSQADHQSTLEAIADNLARLIPYDSCLIFLADRRVDELRPVVVRDPYADALQCFRPLVGQGIFGKVAASGTGRMIVDASLDPEFEEILGVPIEPEAMLVVPMVHKGQLSGVIGLSRFERKLFTEHEFRILSVVASTQAAMAIENARMHERERRILEQYRSLADLGASLATAQGPDEAKELLLRKTMEAFSAEQCFIVFRTGAPDEVEVEMTSGRGYETNVIRLSRNARLAGVQLDSERSLERPVFDAWVGDVAAHIGERNPMTSYLAEPLTTPTGVFGAILVSWDDHREGEARERRILSVIAGAAGATLSNFAARAETDSSLRRRVRELQTLTRLAERITASVREQPVMDEVLSAAIEVGRLEGAAFAVLDGRVWSVRQVSGLNPDRVPAALDALSSDAGERAVIRWKTTTGDSAVAVRFPGRVGTAMIVGFETDAGTLDQDTMLATLARYASVALENARLHDRQDQTIVRLQETNRHASEQYDKLQRLLGVHRSLTLEVLSGGGLEAVAQLLERQLNARVAIIGPTGLVLTSSGAGIEIDLPEKPAGETPQTFLLDEDEGSVVAAPAIVESDVLAWVVARSEAKLSEVDRAAVEYAALLTALDLLRERKAIEVETRMRGGLFDELFNGHFDHDAILKQGLALGFDLSERSRVFVVDPISAEAGPGDLESIYSVVTDVLRSATEGALVALRGNGVVAVAHEAVGSVNVESERAIETHIHDALRRRLPQLPANLGVGTACERLEDYATSYVAARRALDLLRALGRTGEIFSFRDARIEHLLLQTADAPAVVGFVNSLIEPLDRYDKAHSSDLRRTLETFFSARMNLEEAARRLHIHVSTLRYRLGKVEDLLGLDVRGQDHLDIELALRAAKVFTTIDASLKT